MLCLAGCFIRELHEEVRMDFYEENERTGPFAMYTKLVDDKPIAYLFGEPWESYAFFMDDIKGYKTKAEAFAAFKNKHPNCKDKLEDIYI